MAARLDPDEARSIAEQFGVALDQVRRDHLISCILAALSENHSSDLMFFGGTALSRTHLPNGRLSEDIDLIEHGGRNDVAHRLEASIGRALRRSHGRVTWNPTLTQVRDVEAAVLSTDDGLTVRVQLLREDSYPPWPTETRALIQRYTDVGPAELEVPTIEAFAAWKTVAWGDRKASRDLYDLWGLAGIGAMTTSAAELYARLGPTGKQPSTAGFPLAPSEEEWRAQLANQTRLSVTPAAAREAVIEAWGLPDRRLTPRTQG